MNFPRPTHRPLRQLLFALALAACILGTAQAANPLSNGASASADRVLLDAGAAGERFDSFIVYYRDDAAAGDDEAKAALDTRAVLAKDLTRVNARLKLKARQERRIATGGHLLRLPSALAKSAAKDFMLEMAANPMIETIEPNAMAYPTAVPNDTYYSEQWALHGSRGGINVEQAWDHSIGTGVVIAILDTGITRHPDLDAHVLPGYDFISDPAKARDGNGRDSDPSDRGNWNAAGECGEGSPAKDSNWHGTHVAGSAAALANNARGTAGVAPGAYILPVRVLGRCGGSTADVAEAMIWASGGLVSRVPANPTPARVLNLSLGSLGSCSTTYQRAVDSARSRNAVVVTAGGNENKAATGHAPSNCDGAISVGAINKDGKKSSYSNYGLGIDVAAPGGPSSPDEAQVIGATNSGTRGPVSAGYWYMNGTSTASPHVAGVAALILAQNPSLKPDQVATILRNSARPYPSTCTGGCGAGIVDAAAAVAIARGGNYSAFPVSVAVYALYGEGRGKVTSTPARIDCGSACSARFNKGGTVTLRATPASGYAFAGWSGACSGTATTCTLNSLNQAKVALATFQIPVQPLWNGSVRGDLQPVGEVPLMYKLDVPAGATNLKVQISGGSGDADLYVRRDQHPTTENYECRPYMTGNNETCTWATPVAGAYYVMINPASNFSGVRLDVRYTSSPLGGKQLSLTTPERDLAIPKGGARYYRFVVPVDAVNLKIQTQGGSGDTDLYVRHGAVPMFSRYDCRPYKAGNNETCEAAIPTPGTYYIMLYADAASSGITLSASYSNGKRLTIGWSGAGAGTVQIKRTTTGESIASCAALPCQIPLISGVNYTLSAEPVPGSHFPAWIASQCDTIQSDGSCRIMMNRARNATARFFLQTWESLSLTVKRSGTGTGLVAVRRYANDSIVDACTDYPCRVAAPGAGVYDFIALPDPDADFKGWVVSQCDSVLASGECRVRISGPVTVTAKFAPK